MATYRQPKGTYTRPSTDFFAERCATGGVFYKSNLGKSAAVELYNDATDGSYLHVYRVWIQNDAGGGYWVFRQDGTMGGTSVPTYPIISNVGLLPGRISYADADNINWIAPTPFVLAGYFAGNNEAGTQDTYSAPGPVCILAPGASLRALAPAGGPTDFGIMAANFYWAALHDRG